jgi:hypothetical protein
LSSGACHVSCSGQELHDESSDSFLHLVFYFVHLSLTL